MRMFMKILLVPLFTLSALLVGCDANDGPVEEAGQKVDETMEKMSPEQGPMEEMGEDMDDAYKNSKEAAENMKDAASE